MFDAHVSVSVSGIGFLSNLTTGAQSSRVVTLPYSCIAVGNGVSKKAIHIESDRSISVYAMIREKFSSDGFHALPVTSSSTDFFVMSYLPTMGGSEFVIAASEDDTQVDIHLNFSGAALTFNGRSYSSRDKIRATLQSMDALQLQHSSDLSGTRISSDKPVSVTSGNICADIPHGVSSCDYIVEQMLQVKDWQHEYFTAKLKSRGHNRLRVLSGTNNNHVNIGGNQVTLNQGETIEHVRSEDSATRITATYPVMVMQYCEGTEADSATGDPCMICIPGVNGQSSDYVYETSSPFAAHYVTITIGTDDASGLLIDGTVVLRSDELRIMDSNNTKSYSVIRISVSQGQHNIKHIGHAGFAAIVYGFGPYESYGYPLGLGTHGPEAIRLTNGTSSKSGVLEVNVDGHWFGICAGGISTTEVHALCGRLGYDKYGLPSQSISAVSTPTPMSTLHAIRCDVSPQSIDTCTFTKNTGTCTNAVHVDCTPTLNELVTVSCTSTNWHVDVDMDKLNYRYPGSLSTDIYFGDNSCLGTEVGRHLIFDYDINRCLTTDSSSEKEILYKNQLVYAYHDPKFTFIIRNINWTLDVNCHIQRNQSIDSHVTYNQTTGGNQGSLNSTLAYEIETQFFIDPNFQQQISGNPLDVGVGSNVFVKTFVQNVEWTVKMRLHSCYTDPAIGGAGGRYYLIKNGCEMDANTHFLSQTDHETTFVFQAFQMTGTDHRLFVKCDATLCDTTDTTSSQQCDQNPHCS
ncbi:uncharacterized protein LOC127878966 isoform X2 [Dreissena polymorpha]|nr:uncharacterized protein LOC127878966 isoform X2 [Dreissena polymorpha]